MPDPNERDAKLIQYLQEAYGKEQELEVAIQADLMMTPKGNYQKRLKQHLKETKAHAKALDRRIKKLGGGGGSTVQKLVGKATAAAKGPLHMVRGSGEQEKLLKNAKTQITAEHEEIGNYLAIETFATKVGDPETAKLARDIRREEERMAKFLEGQLKQLANAVAIAEVPVAQRRGPSKAKRSSAKKSTSKSPSAKPAAKKSTASKSKSSAKKSTSKSKSSAKSKSKSTAKKASAKKTGARKSSKAKARSK